MNKELISDRQGIAIIVYFILNSALIFPTAVDAGKDLWIAIAISIAFSVPMVIIYSRILSLFPNKDFFHILHMVFGKIISKIFIIVYIWFAIQLASLTLRDFGEMLSKIIIRDTPQSIILLVLSILTIWMVKEGIELIGNFSIKTVFVIVSMTLLFIILLIPDTSITRLQPVMENGFKPIIKGSFSAFSFPFGETVLFMMILNSLNNKSSIYKVYLYGLLIGGTVIFITELNNILVIGINTYKTLYFPAYNVVRQASLGEAIQRFEILGSFIVIPAGVIKIAVCMLAASKGLASIFNFKDYRFLVIPLVLLMTNLSYWSFESIIDLSMFSAKYWPYYASVFQIILPIIILVFCEIRKHKLRV